MEIRRDSYLNKLMDRMGNGLVKIITGVRRCGKTWLLLRLFRRHLAQAGIKDDHVIAVMLDDLENAELRDPNAMLRHIKDCIADGETYYVLLDEVQLLRQFEEVLNSLLHVDNVDIYVTGSNSRFLSSDVITEFRGRGDEIRIHPLSFREFLSAHGGTKEEAWDDYFLYGGLPLVLSYGTPEGKAEYLTHLLENVYLSDIVERRRVQHEEELGELLDILASSIGSLTNPLKLSRTFKSVKNRTISDKTLKKYIDYMTDAFLLERARRFDLKGKRYIASAAKYYFEDIGLRNARLGFRQTEENHIMENIIYNELRIRGYHVDVGVLEAFGKKDGATTRKQLEVDFTAARGSRKYYIQSAFSLSTPEKLRQEQNSLLHIGDSFRKLIIVRDNIRPRHDEAGITTIGIWNFLLDENSLDL